MKTKDFLNFLPEEQRNSALARFGLSSLNAALFLTKWKPILSIAFNILFLIAASAFPALAQPNPWGGSGTTRLANAGSNVLVIGTWIAFFVGILSFVLIPLFIKMEWNYKKLIFSGLTGLGGFMVMGSIAYDVINLNSVDMPDPTIGN